MECNEECSAVSASTCTEFSKGTKLPHQCVGKNGADDYLIDKKHRLTSEQINYLEMSFRMDIKLEQERKALIAKELGIRPRQVAIWFQNRRVRWKNKQLEQDYEMLKVKHDAVITEKENLIKEYESTLQDNKRLQAEVDRLMNLIQGNNVLGMNGVLSSSKKEQISNNSELMSPTKSVDYQSEIDDIFMPVKEHKAVMTNLNGTVECAWRAKGDCSLFISSDNVFDSFPMLVQQLIANGHSFEDAYNIYLGCEYFGGWR